MGRANRWRKGLFKGRVVEAVGQVRQIGSFCPHDGGGSHGFFDVQVRWVGISVPQGIQHKDSDPFEPAEGFGRKRFCIGDVTQIAHTESEWA